jgi:hypothetical protein
MNSLEVVVCVLGGALVVAAVVYWDRIYEWATGVIDGWIRESSGDVAADSILHAVAQVDTVVRAARRVVRRVVAYVRTKSGGTTVKRRVHEEVVAWDDLPAEVREKLKNGVVFERPIVN